MDSLAAAAFRRHYGQIYRYVRRRSASAEQAEDIAQEVFLAAAERLDEFKPGTTPVLAWLYTVAQRRLVDYARHEGAAARARATADGPGDHLYGGEVASSLRRAIERLPSAQREVVMLKVLRGASFAEIANHTGTTQGAARMRLVRALDRLRRELEREGIAP